MSFTYLGQQHGTPGKQSTTHEFITAEAVRAKAQEMQALGNMLFEREMRAHRKAHIREVLIQGRHLPFEWDIAHVDGHPPCRVNGQHSSAVMLELHPDEWKYIRFPIVIHETHYQCASLEDLAYLFNQRDQQWPTRSREDHLAVHLGAYPALRDINRRIAVAATQGIEWYRRHVEGKRLPAELAQYAMVHEEGEVHAFLQFCHRLELHTRKVGEMLRKPVMAAMFHTARKDDPDVYDFWLRVSRGTDGEYDHDAPLNKLAEFLELAHTVRAEWPSRISARFANGHKPSTLEVFATCLRLFVAHKRAMVRVELFEKVKDTTARQIVEYLSPYFGR